MWMYLLCAASDSFYALCVFVTVIHVLVSL